ncbi:MULTISPECIES: cyclopropane-fatty-acyl-phospholipid synthase family protein [Nocardia]|uniref:SAM-dependent methyltransferase n=1 Tax=Nocardia TaxID=1817 RepID=UPI00135A09D3|nr:MULTISPECIES: class I SAM-dependent methyltransferase [Nocardia]
MTRNPSQRRAFDYMRGHVTCAVFASLGIIGVLDELAEHGLRAADLGTNRYLAEATLRYLAQRDIVARGGGDRYVLTEAGRQLYADRGYLMWLSGGYGDALHHFGDLLTGKRTFGSDIDRDVRWVAVGTALVGQRDLRPEVMAILEEISFDSIADIGCGNAHFLIAACQAGGGRGVGVDISPAACAEAQQEVAKAGLADRITIHEGDGAKAATIPQLESVQLVVTFFFLHEVLEHGYDVLVNYLRGLCDRLPSGAYMLTAEEIPPATEQNVPEVLTPEYSLTQALMEQSLLTEDGWRKAFGEAGFDVVRIVQPNLPDCRLILTRKPT